MRDFAERNLGYRAGVMISIRRSEYIKDVIIH
jgi:hypothetical protein